LLAVGLGGGVWGAPIESANRQLHGF
jgi:hypothetical protein